MIYDRDFFILYIRVTIRKEDASHLRVHIFSSLLRFLHIIYTCDDT
jgi:hypothetical protein